MKKRRRPRLDGIVKNMETWLPIPGFEGLYEASDEGRIRSLVVRNGIPRKAPRILTPRPDRRRPQSVRLAISFYQDGRRIWSSVHRSVAAAFLGPCPPGMECCHWDGDTTNNRLANLRWDTKLGNAADDRRNGVNRGAPKGERHYLAKLSEDDARLIKASPPGPETTILARRYGVSPRHIRAIRTGRTWSHLEAPP